MLRRFVPMLTIMCAMSASLLAWDDCGCASNRFYIGGFGGGLYSDSSRITQMGTAFFTEAAGGPLAVHAEGNAKSTSTGFGGVQLGYEWAQPVYCGCSDWSISTAAEVEAYFYSHKRKGDLVNDSLRLEEHDFRDSFSADSSVILANAVFSLNSSSFWGLTPYVGGGLGATHISLSKATSTQINPPEVGVNHFNNQRSDSAWAFVGQVKAGLRYQICESFHIFGEYRYLFVDSSNYIFGSTNYPTHAATSPWNVKLGSTHYNAFAVGFQYDL